MCCKNENEDDGVPCTSFTQQLLQITKCPKHYVVATKETTRLTFWITKMT